MTFEFTILPWIIGAIMGIMLADIFAIGTVGGIVLGLLVGALVTVLWVYSPLPNRTASFGAQPNAGYWGFKNGKE